MAKTHWVILFTTFLISCISLALLIVSIATPYWIISSARHASATYDSEVNYGLFSGSLDKYVLSSGSKYELSIICNYGDAACIYSCQGSQDSRQDDLERILQGKPVLQCPSGRSLNLFSSSYELNARQTETNDQENQPNEQYIISGYWASTVSFLIISIIFTFIAALMSIINVVFNPVEWIFSIFGLHIWNGISISTMLLTVIIWGSLYETSLRYNIAITDTLQSESPYSSNGLASLGYSYWIILVSIFLSLGNISLLLLRKYLIEKHTPPPTITVERNDYTIMLY